MLLMFGKPDIEKLKDRGDIEGLIKALSYKKKKKLSKPEEWRVFARDGMIRSEAASALGEIGSHVAVNPLIEALDDEYGAREAAAKALAKLSTPYDKRAVEVLIEGLGNWSNSQRAVALEALVGITGRDFGDDIPKWKKWWNEYSSGTVK